MLSARTVPISVMTSVKFVQSNVMDSVKFVQISVTDSAEVVQIHSTMSEDDEIREIQRGRCDYEDVGFQEAGVMNNAEEIRERCKTETNIEMRRESGMAKIDGVEEGDEAEGAGGREESDEWEEFGNRKVVRKHDPRQPSQQ